MQYEIDLIKRKAKMAMNEDINQETKTFLTDIIKLADACLNAIESIDIDLTSICLSMRRNTTDIK